MRRLMLMAWFERWHIVRRSKAVMAMLALVVALCTMIQGFAVGAVESYARDVDERSNLTLIELNALSGEARVIDDEGLAEVSAVAHVVKVVPWMQHDLDLADESDWPDRNVNPGSLWATTYMETRLPAMIRGGKPARLGTHEIILPSQVEGGSLDHLVGRTLRFGYTHIDGEHQGSYLTIDLKVVGVYDNSVPDKDGVQPSYVNGDTLKELYGQSLPTTYSFAYVQVDSAQNAPAVQRQLSEMGFGVSGAGGARDAAGLIGALVKAGDVVLPIVVVCALVFGLFVGSLWMRQRRRDLALLRCLGYSSTATSLLALWETAMMTMVAGVCGVLLGRTASFAVSRLSMAHGSAAMRILESGWFNPMVDIQVLGIMLLGGVVGTVPMALRMARISPDELMRA